MTEEQDYMTRKFNEVFDDTYEQVTRLRKADPSFNIKDLEGLLHSQYVYEGTDWIGRGQLGHVVSSATIAAYEQYLAEWKRDIESPSDDETR